MKRFIRLACITGVLLGAINTVQGQSRQIRLGDNMGDHMAAKDLDMNSKQILNAEGIAIGSATITNQNVAFQIDGTNKAILMPRITALSAIASPVNGMLVYNSADNKFYVRENGVWVSFATVTDLNNKTAAVTVDNISIIKDNTGALAANVNSAIWNANRLQGNAVSATAPLTGQVLSWNGTAWVPANATSVTAQTVTAAAQPAITSVGTLTGLSVTNPIAGSVTGNAATATKLATPRNINGVPFDGSANITITAAADANTLTGTTLNPNILNSSLTSVGTLTGLTVTNPIAGSITGNAATATSAATAGTVTTAAQPAITSVGTLSGLTVTAPIAGSVTGNAGTATKLATARNINGVAFDGTANINVGSSNLPFTPAGSISADNVQAAMVELDGDIALKAPLTSPALTGVPTAPTAAPGTNSTQLATTAFVTAAAAAGVADADATTKGKIQLTGQLGGTAASPTIANAAVISKTLTDYAAGAGVVSSSDNILTAIQKLDGNNALKAPLANPTFTGTVSGITKTMVGLGNADNTSDANKPVSTATQTALDLKAPLASPALTGTPTAPTAAPGTNTTQLATTAFVTAAAAAGTPDATNLAAGKIQLAGDLSGTAAAPTITNAAVIGKVLTGYTAGAGTVAATDNILQAIQKVDGNNALKAPLANPTFTGTVSGITKTMVGLGNADNTSDANKPVSTATQTALDLKAPLASPALTGTPTAPTAAPGTNTTQLATTAFVTAAAAAGTPDATNLAAGKIQLAGDLSGTAAAPTITNAAVIGKVLTGYTAGAGTVAATDNILQAIQKVDGNVALKAPLANPTFTGTVSGITKTMVGLGNADNTSDANKPVSTATQTALDLKASLASPALTGTPTAPTAAPGTNTTQLATTAFVTAAAAAGTPDATNLAAGKIQLAGDLAGTAAAPTITNAAVIGKVLTGYTAGAGTVAATDNILQAIQKVDGNVALKAPLANPTFTGTVSGITKTMVGLGNVDNTADADKPVSSAAQTALNLKAPLASPTFTGTVTLPSGTVATTQTPNNNSTAVATTAYVDAAAAAGTPDATNLAAGKIQLAGDLSGTAAAPTITNAAVIGKVLTGYTAGAGTVAATDNILQAIQKVDGNVALKAPLANPTFTGTVSGITKTMVGLGNVDNTADADKPVSSAAQTALNLKAPLASPTFTGTVTLPSGTVATTQTPNNNSTAVATTAYVDAAAAGTPDATNLAAGKIQLAGDLSGTAAAPTITNAAVIGKVLTGYTAGAGTVAATDNILQAIQKVDGNVALKAPLANPTFTGTVSGITKTMVGLGNVDNTADADKPVSSAAQTALNLKAPLASPTFTGTVTLPSGTVATTQTPNNNSTAVATTAYVDAAAAAGTPDATNLAAGKIQLAGDLAGTAAAPTITNAAVIGKVLTGYTAGAGTVAATDNILQAIQKVDGNVALKAPLANPTFTGTVSGITKTMVGLGNVDNTADADKPVSSAAQTALNLKAPLASPTFTGTVTLPSGTVATTQTPNNNSTAVATTAYVDAAAAAGTPDATNLAAGKIQLAGDLSGTAAAPTITNAAVIGKVLTGYTAGAGTVAATDNILQAIQKVDGNVALKAPLASPTFTGTVTLPVGAVGVTQLAGDNSTKLATTAYADAAAGAAVTGKQNTLTNSAGLAGALSDETGTGVAVFATSPTLTTPTIGVATATSVNKVAITAPATGSTLTIADGKTLTASNSLTLTGTDGSTLNVGTGGTLGTNAYTSTAFAPLASPTFTGTVTLPSGTVATTQTPNNNSTAVATTAYVDAAAAAGTPDATNLAAGKIQLAGDLAGTAAAPTITNAAVIGKVLTGYTAGAGTVAATDNILQAIQKVDGNVALKAPLANPTFTGTVSGITKTMVGLGNVDNTADADKPVSSAAQTALNLKAPLASPTFTGTVTLPSGTVATTQTPNNNSTAVATTAYVDAAAAAGTPDATNLAAGKIQLAGDLAGTAAAPTITNAAVIGKVLTGYTAGAGAVAATDNILQAIQKVDGNVALKAPLANPTFTGTVSGITKAMVGLGNVDNTSDSNKPVSSATQSALDLKASLASPTFTGTVTLPSGAIGVTQTPGDNSTKLATTAYADAAAGAAVTGKQDVLTNSAGLAGALSDETGTGLAVFATSPTLVTPNLGTPSTLVGTNITGTAAALNIGGNAATATLASTVTTNANLTGEVTSTGNATTVTNAAVIGKVLTGYTAGAGTVAATDNILQAIQKVDGNVALRAPLASPTFTGTPTLPTGTIAVTQAANNNSTAVATTAYADAAAGAAVTGKQDVLTNSAGLAGALSDETGTGLAVFATSPTLVTPNLGTPSTLVGTNITGTAAALNIGGNAATATLASTVTTNANLTGEVTSTGNATTVTNAAVIGKVLTGYTAGAGTVAATDNILQAIQKVDGNVALRAPLASPTFTGTPTLPTGTIAVTQAANNNSTAVATTAYADAAAGAAVTGKQDVLTNSAGLAGALSDETGTGLAVFATSPTLVTPNLGTPSTLVGTNITGTAAALNIGGNAATATLASTVTTNANLTGEVTSTGNATTVTNAAVIGKVLTGYTSGAGTVAATDNILQAIQKIDGNDALKAPLASPALTGTPTAPTQTAADNSTKLATTAYADNAASAAVSGKQNTLTNSAGLAGALSDETGTGLAVFATSPTLVTPNLGTPSTLVGTNITGTAAALNIGGNAATATLASTVTTNANLTGEVTSTGNATTVTNAAVIGKVLTGYTAGAGTVAATDNILQAIQKVDGNVALRAPLASPTFTGTPTLPTGTIAVTQAANNNSTAVATTAYADAAAGAAVTGKQDVLTNSAGLAGALSDETGTGVAVFATSPTLVTPNLGTPSTLVGTNITGTAAALNIGGNAATATLASTVTTNANLTGEVTSTGNATTVTNAAVIGKVLTGYTAGAGTVAATDNILQAIQKIDGNDALKAPLASPTFTGTPTLPTGTIAVTQAANNNSTAVATTAYADAQATAAVSGKQNTLTNSAGLAGALSDETGTGLAVFATSPTLVTPNLGTPSTLVGTNITGTAAALNIGGNAATATLASTVTTNANLTGEVTSTGNATTVTNAAVIGKVLTGYTAGAGTVAATDNILQAIQKIDGNDALKAPLASPALTGTPTAPTQTAADNSTKLATTAYADNAASAAVSGKQNTLTNSAGLAGALSDETGTGLAVFATSPTLVTPNLGTPSTLVGTNITGTAAALNIGGNAATATLASTVTTNANLTGEVTSTGNATTVTNAAVIGKVLTGYTAGAGTVAATDNILQAIQKVDGNVALRAPLASPTFTGTPTLPTGTIAVTQAANNNSTAVATTAYADAAAGAAVTGKQDVLTNSAGLAGALSDETGTGLAVFATSPTLVTPNLGTPSTLVGTNITGTAAALNIGGNAATATLASTVTTNANLTGEVTSTGNATTVTNAAVIGKVLTGYTAGAGTVAATDNILQAIQKVDGNVALRAPLASPTFTGTPTLPTGTIAVTQAANNNSTAVATTAYADAAAGAAVTGKQDVLTNSAGLAGALSDETGTGVAVFATSPTLVTPNLGTPSTLVGTNITGTAAALNIGGNAATATLASTVTTNANLTGEVTSTGNATTVTNAAVIGKVLTGYTAGAGTVAATDNILQAIQKIDGNDALKAPLASPTFTGTPTLPTGTIAVTQAANNNSTAVATTAYADAQATAAVSGKQNTLTNSAGLAGALSDETGTGLAVFATSPTLVTPNLGTPSTLVGTNITGTAAALNIGGNAATATLASTVTTNANLTGEVTSTGNATTVTNAAVIGKVLTGYTAGAGTVAATDNILQAIQKIDGNDALKAPLASPALTGTPTAPTQTAADNSTKLATTAYADNAASAAVSGKQNTLTNSAGLAGALSDETGTGLAVFATSPTLVTPNLGTPSTLVGTNITGTAAALNIGGNAATATLASTVTTNANLTGEVTSTGNATTVTNAAVIGKVLTGYTAGAGTVAATDNILQAIQKVDGNVALRAPLASPTFTGTPTLPTGTIAVTQAANNNSTAVATTAYADAAAGAAVTGKQDVLTNSAGLAGALSDETGTGLAVFATSPTLVTPNLGTPSTLVGTNITGTAAALNIGGNAATATLASTVTTNANLTGEVTSTGNATTVTNAAVIGKVLTGYTAGAGTVAATDNILQAIQKVDGNVALRAPLASPTFTGTPTLPTGTIAVTQAANNNSTAVATTAYADAQAAAAVSGKQNTLTNSAGLAGALSDETGTGLAVFATSPTLVTPNLGTPSTLVGTNITGTAAALNIGGNAATATLASTVTTNANLTGEVTSTGNATTVTNAAVIGKVLTGYTAGAGTVAATDNILQAIQKVDGNVALRAPLASPTFTGTPTLPTGTIAVTQAANNNSTAVATTAYADAAAGAAVTGKQDVLTNSAGLAGALSDETGTGVAVFATSPTLVTPNLGTPSTLVGTNITGTAAALNIGGNAATATLASTVTTNANLTGEVTSTGNATTVTNAAVIGKVLTGYTAGAGTVAATDNILQAIQKVDGNVALRAPLASPTFTGTPTLPTGTVAVTQAANNNSTAVATTAYADAAAGAAVTGKQDVLTNSAGLAGALSDETGTGLAVFATSPTLVTPNLGTPSTLVGTNITGTAAALNIGGNAATATLASTVTTNANLTGEVTSTGNATTVTNAAVIGKVLTGYTAGAGTVAATDNILQAIQKVDGNVALRAPLASPTFTGTPTLPTGTIAVTQAANNNSTAVATTAYADAAAGAAVTGKQDVLTNSAGLAGALSDETGTGLAVFATSPTLVTPNLGTPSTLVGTNITGTAAALNIGGNAATATLASTVTTNANLTGEVTSTGNATTVTNAAVIGKVLTGYTSGAGTVAATDNILQAIQKIDGNDALKAPLASPTFTGTVTLPTGTVAVTQAANNNSTAVATTAYADAQATAAVSGKQNTLTNSAGLAGALSDETGTGLAVFATSPTLTTPTIGVATATSVNKVAITAPTTGSTLTIADGKTLTASNSLTLSGTDGSTLNVGTGGTLGTNAYTSTAFAPLASPTFTGTVTLPTGTVAVTQAANNNTTAVATTAYADAQAAAAVSGKQNTLTNSAGLAGALSDETGTGLAVFATSPTLVTPNLGTPSTLVGTNITGTAAALNIGGNAATATLASTVTTNANLTGEVTSTGNATTVTNAAVIGKVLTGYTAGAGTVAATDNILQAIQKIDGNDALKAPLASPTFTGTPTLPTGTIAVTQAANNNSTAVATTAYADAQATAAVSGKQNTLTNSAGLAGALSDETGTGLAVFATSPTLVTPNLGTPSTLVGTNITGTAAGLTAGTVTTNANLTGEVTSTGNATTVTNAAVIGKVLTGYTSGAGTVAATDNILQAIQKLNGNDALKAPLASPTFTGTPTLPTGTIAVTQAANNNSTAVATTAYADAQAAAAVSGKQNTLTNSAGLAGALSDETGTGLAVFATSPTLTTPTIGVATATSVNKVAITAPTTGSTLTIADGKTLTASNSLTLSGTDGSTLNVGTGGTLGTNAYTSTAFAPLASPTFTGTVTLPTGTVAVTQAANNNTTAVATTAYADAQAAAAVSGKQNTLTNSAGLAGALSDETGTGLAVFATSPTLVTPNLGTPSTLVGTNITGTAAALNIGGNAATATLASTVTTNANLTGEVTSTGNATTVTNAAVIGKVLTGYTAGAGTVAATDNILQAIQKIDGNDALKAPLASPTFTGTPTLPTGTIAVTQAANNNSTAVATTAYADAQATAAVSGKQNTLTNSAGLAGALSDETGTGLAVFATSPTLVTPNLGTPSTLVGTNITGTAAGLTAGTVTTNANLTGEVTSTGNATTVTNAAVIGKVLTGYTSGAGTVAATDNILQAIQKLSGNDALKAPLASPTFTGTPTLPTGTIAVTQAANNNSTAVATTAYADAQATAAVSGKQNTLTNSAGLAGALSDETGTGLAVFATSPTLVTPNLGTPSTLVGTNITGTAAGLTAGTVTTNANLTGEVTSTGNATTVTNAAVIGKVLTGYTSGAGTVAATDNILQAIQKLNGNDALKAPLASPTFTGTPTLPTGTIAVTQAANNNSTAVATTAYADAQATAAVSGKQNTLTNSAGLAGALSDETGTGLAVFATSPTLTTPTIGVATATSVNKVAITAPTTGSTLTIADGKTLTASNSLTLSGTDGSTLNVGTGGTLGTNAYTSTAFAPLASPTFTGTVTLPTGTVAVTQAANNNTTAVATTAYADAQATAAVSGKQNTLTNSAGLAGALSDETGTGVAVFATSPTLVTPNLGTPSTLVGTNITGTAAGLTAGTVTTNANLTGEVTSTGNATTVTNAAVIGKVLTGYTSGAGTVAATDNILQAIQKLNGNDALKAPLASPTFTGTPTLPTGTIAVTQAANNNSTAVATTAYADAQATAAVSGKQNTLTNSAGLAGALSDETGTGLAVFATSPTLTTPTIGVATATSVNKVAITAPTTGSTLTIADGKTLTASNSLTLSGTDGSTLNVGTGGTLGTNAYTSTAFAPLASPTFTGTVTLPTGTVAVTQAANNNTTAVATTAYADAQATAAVSGKQNTLTNSAGLAGALSDETGTGLAVFATSPTLVTPNLGTPSTLVGTNITGTAAGLTAGTVTTNANLTGEVTSTGNATTVTNAAVIGKVLTGYTSGAGTVAATDNILQAIQKLNGNDALKAPLASPTFTGTPTLPTGTIAVTQAANNNSTAVATTAYADAQAAAAVSGKQNTLTNSAGLAGALSDETGTGLAVFATSPTLTTPTIGVATATSVNKVAITAPATSATLTIANGKTLTASNTLTFTGTDGSTLNVGTGGTLGSNAYTSTAFAPLASPTFTGTPTLPTGTIAVTQAANNNSTAVATTAYADAQATAAVSGKQNTLTNSAGLAGALSDETGTGLAVFATSPVLTTPTIGVATATSVNKVAITAPATGSTLTIADGKTLTASNSLTFTGTDGSTLNVGTGGTLGTNAYTSTAFAPLASPTFTGTPTLPTGTIATTQAAANNTTAVATTAYVDAADNLKADLASPALTGTPTAPTAAAATNTTQIATTEFVQTAIPTKVIALAANATANATATPTEITGLSTTLPAGTYTFQYFIRYQSGAAGTGVRFNVNSTATTTAFVWNTRWVDLSATASTAAADQDAVLATGSVMGAFGARAKRTTGATGTTISVDTINSDMLMVIEGLFISTGSGDLELWHGSENANSTQVMAGSSLIVTKTL